MVFVCISTIIWIFLSRNQTTVVAPVGNSSVIERFGTDLRGGSILIPATAATKPAVVLTMPVISNPPIIRTIMTRPMAMAISVITSVIEPVRRVAVAEIDILLETNVIPTILYKNATVPSLIATVYRTFEICTYRSRPFSASFLHFGGTLSILKDWDSCRAIMVFTSVGESICIIWEGRSSIISALLTILGPSSVTLGTYK
mmetsp:Transcript_2552/g.2778  ORF Transcript_2552/g.2778 Transcript_2552/m.2778 type:complete len:201 (+) Transcript_2552:690-1292(+)